MKEQVKKKKKQQQDQVNKEEIGNLSEKEFRVMIEKKFQDIKTEWKKYKKHLTKTYKK